VLLRNILLTYFLFNLVWEKLKSTGKTDEFKADTMEEFEDQDGNVFNKKTYDDLKRQGLL
jgi:splicing factor 3A subunit 3